MMNCRKGLVRGMMNRQEGLVRGVINRQEGLVHGISILRHGRRLCSLLAATAYSIVSAPTTSREQRRRHTLLFGIE